MEITTVLNVGSGADQTLLGFILYPDSDGGNASNLIRIGDPEFNTCERIQGQIDLLVEVPYRIAGQAGYEARDMYDFPIRANSVTAQPAAALRELKSQLQARANPARQSVAVVLTGGLYFVNSTGLQEAANDVNSTPDFDIIAAGFVTRASQEQKLRDDLATIAGAHNHVVFSDSATNSLALIQPTLQILENLNVICPNKSKHLHTCIDCLLARL